MIELRDVEVVDTIAKFGGIHPAACELGLSQPALTKRLKAIEERLQLTLFHRLPRGVKLTPSGELYLARGADLLIHANDFADALKRHKSGDDGALRIGVKPGVHDVFFRNCMAAFASQFPNVHLMIDMNSSPILCRAIRSGALDFAIVGLDYEDEFGDDPALHDSLVFEPLFRLPLEVVVRKDHPVLSKSAGPYDILSYPLACPEPPPVMLRNMEAAAQSAGLTFNGPNILIDDYEFILRLLTRSDFWTGTFQANNPDLQKRGRFEFLAMPEVLPTMTIGVAARKTWAMPPAAIKLIEMMTSFGSDWKYS